MSRAESVRPDLIREPDQLLALALARPREAIARAREVLAGDPREVDASVAHQTIGIVLRDRSELDAAIAELRTALRYARAGRSAERETDVEATLGVTLVWSGRPVRGLAMLDRAADKAHGDLAGRVLLRRASALRRLGRNAEALEDLTRALTFLRRAQDVLWEARARTHRGEIFLAFGDTTRASADYVAAEALFAACHQDFEYAINRHNRGRVAQARGDLPAALSYYDEAARLSAAIEAVNSDLALERCTALLAAGLAADAVREADRAALDIGRRGGDTLRAADMVYTAANAALVIGDLVGARDRADRALRLFKKQGRVLWEARAQIVLAHAAFLSGDGSSGLLRRASAAADQLENLRDEESKLAHLVAGRIALAGGQRVAADVHLEKVAKLRRHESALNRSLGWLAHALRAEAAENWRTVRSACAKGLDALEEQRAILGATELRAHASSRGAELTVIAERDALRRGDTRSLLLWTERWRATAIGLSAPAPTEDRDQVTELAALRAVSRRLELARAEEQNTSGLERERRALEQAVRARALRASGGRSVRTPQLDLDELISALGDVRLVELIEFDGTLHAITVAGGIVKRHEVGRMPANDVAMARSVLTRMSRGRPPPHAQALLDQVGNSLERVLLGAARDDLGDGPVVLIPPGALHAVPWSLLPSLRARTVSVAPSAAVWLRATKTPRPAAGRVALVVGPDLGTAGAELPELARHYPQATVLGSGTATADNVLAALDGAALAHIAAHGTFRADNPLFSALRMDDGPLTVHDLERLHRAPYRVVLSSCDSGVAAPVGADELLGLVSSLIPLGAVGIVASVVPVNDAATVPLMLALHDALRTGASLPDALARARASTDDDPISCATGRSFIALGA